ncbi:GFA family protein [Vibrio nereis]|uniref:GFA family protein n=1 Tax=Vibrio nereis TaxID=693 RepID=UPI0014701CC0
MKVRTAECSCGQVKLICRGDPERTAICHCFECQKRTGSVFGVQARFDQSQISYSGDMNEYSRITESGNEVTYFFCPCCSTTMLMRLSALPNTLVVPVGVFNQQDLPIPSFSVYEERMHTWVKFDCQVERNP